MSGAEEVDAGFDEARDSLSELGLGDSGRSPDESHTDRVILVWKTAQR